MMVLCSRGAMAVCSRGVTAMGEQPIDACSEGSMGGGGSYGEEGAKQVQTQ